MRNKWFLNKIDKKTNGIIKNERNEVGRSVRRTMVVPNFAAAVLGHEGQALAVRVVVAVAALQSLLEQPAQQLLAVAADGEARVRVHLEGVRDSQRGARPAARHGAGARRRTAALAAAAQLRTRTVSQRVHWRWHLHFRLLTVSIDLVKSLNSRSVFHANFSVLEASYSYSFQ